MAAGGPIVGSASSNIEYDIVVAHGLVVDGTGRTAANNDVGIVRDVVAATGPPGSLRGRMVIDATGCIVAPGFFDIHSHADFTVLADGRAESAIRQGVTSIVTGNCGFGIAPITALSRELVPMNAPGWRVANEPPGLTWTSFCDYLETLRRRTVAVNVFPLVAHGALRLAVSGFEARPLDGRELSMMVGLAEEAMAAGAIGFSTGLEYAPGLAATRDELEAVASVVGRHDGLYATHCRNRAHLIEAAVDEAVQISTDAGCRLQLSHFVPRPSYADRDPYRRALDAGRAAPVPTLFDVFPFDHGPTPLAFVLPDWARQGGRADVAARLADATLRERLIQDLDPRFQAMARSGAADSAFVASDGGAGRAVGATLGELRAGRSVSDAALALLAAAGDDFWDVCVVEPWATEADLTHALVAEDYIIMGDGITTANDGPLAGCHFSLSDWGYAPTMLARYVRDEPLTTLEGAIHRMTLLPARQAGAARRGAIAAGWAADVVVLDMATLDAGSDPARLAQPPSGIHHVIVNGTPVLTSGRLTRARPGRVGR